MARGGYRPGSGRKKGSKASHTLAAETFRKTLIERVIKEKTPIITALINKAKKGDVLAIKEINERVLGKVTQPVAYDKDTLKTIQTMIAKVVNE